MANSEIPLVSVAMASFNGDNFITELLNSLINQTYPNIEIIITDDASTDNTVSLIKEFQQQNPSIQLFQKKKNSGYAKTFEESIIACKGDFIALCDQDDIWKLDKIERLLKEIGEADAIYSNSLLIDKSGKSLGIEYKAIANLKSFYGGAAFLMGNSVSGHSILIKKALVKNILPFPGNIMFDRWISFCAASRNGLKFLDEPLVEYRQHDNNTFGVGKKIRTKNKKRSRKEKFRKKTEELKTFEGAKITDKKTLHIIKQMRAHLHSSWSVYRSLFFFRNRDELLVIKKRSVYRKMLYCLKMVFKANY